MERRGIFAVVATGVAAVAVGGVIALSGALSPRKGEPAPPDDSTWAVERSQEGEPDVPLSVSRARLACSSIGVGAR